MTTFDNNTQPAKPLFDPAAQPPSPWQVGDRVRFFAIDYATYLAQGGAP